MKFALSEFWFRPWTIGKLVALAVGRRLLGEKNSRRDCTQLKMFRPVDPTDPVSDLMPPGYVFVEANPHLNDEWIALINESKEFPGQATWTLETLEKTIIAGLVPGGAVLVAGPGDRLVGCVSVCRRTRNRRAGVIMYMLVQSNHRALGIGHAMMQRAIRICGENGIDELTLLTDDYRLNAIRLYLRNGFKPDTRRAPALESKWNGVLARLNQDRVRNETLWSVQPAREGPVPKVSKSA